MTAPSKLLFSIVRSFFTSRVGEVHDICWPAPLMGYRRFPVTGTRTRRPKKAGRGTGRGSEAFVTTRGGFRVQRTRIRLASLQPQLDLLPGAIIYAWLHPPGGPIERLTSVKSLPKVGAPSIKQTLRPHEQRFVTPDGTLVIVLCLRPCSAHSTSGGRRDNFGPGAQRLGARLQ